MTPASRDRWPARTGGSLASAAVVLLVLLATTVASAAAPRPGPARRDTAAVTAPATRPDRVIAYYFHTNYRCASCRSIEAFSREALQRAFAAELADGRLVWKTVNLEVAGNEHFAKDFALYTKAVVLVHEVRGRPGQWKNLEKVWQLLQDRPKFERYVQDEARAFMASRS